MDILNDMDIPIAILENIFDLLILLNVGLALLFVTRVRRAMREPRGLNQVMLAFAVCGAVFVGELAIRFLPAELLPGILANHNDPLLLLFRRGAVLVFLTFIVAGIYVLSRRELAIIRELTLAGQSASRHAVAARRLASQLDEAQQFAQMGSWEWRLVDDRVKTSAGLRRIHGLEVGAKTQKFDDLEGRIHPADRQKTRHILRRAAAGESGPFDYRIIRPDGEVRSLHAQLDVDWDGDRPAIVHAALIDVTDRVVAEEQSRFSRDLHRAVVDSTFDGILTFDPDANTDLFNSAAQNLFGYDGKEMHGSSALRLLPHHLRAPFMAEFASYLESGESSLIGHGPFETEGRHKTGELFPMEMAMRDVQVQNSRLFVATVRDISARKMQEMELRQAQKLQAIGQLTGGVAHDFNNIITSIMGNLELLRESVSDRPVAENFADEALAAAGRAATLTQQLLAFSRKQALRPEPVDVNAMVTATTQLLRKTVDANISIELDLADPLWRTMADESQLESALLNLAFNARDAMPDGGRLTIQTRNFSSPDDNSVEGLEDGDYVALTVSDSGEGMSAEIQQRVFEPFFTTKPVGMGSGLGLSMVYGFVCQSGGSVTLQSAIGEGTSITLFLPQTDQLSTAPAAAGGGGVETKVGGDETILVIEDDPSVRTFLQLALEVMGYEVMACEDGESALEMLAASDGVDLVLTDVMLPGMTGPELGTRIKTLFPDTPILYSSGYTRDEMIRNGRLPPDVNLIEKPYSRQDLAAVVRQLLDSA